MVNIFTIYKPIMHGVMKLSGVRPRTIEIEPGTVMKFWAPSKLLKKSKKSKNNNRKKSKPAVVFLHGFALDGIFTWQFQVPSLTKKYSVYVPDFLFFGGSTTDKSDRSPAFQAECVAKGLMRLGVEKCTVVGWSYGGMIACKMAELYPELVESIVLSGAVPTLTRSITDEMLERVGFKCWSDFLLPDTVEGVKYMYGIAQYKSPPLPDWVYKHMLEATYANIPKRKELLEALVVDDKDVTVTTYPQRVHLLWGESDKIYTMEQATNLVKQLGETATLHSIKKACHLVHVEQSSAYNKRLKEILASVSEDSKRQD